jgi:hypothetical protein
MNVTANPELTDGFYALYPNHLNAAFERKMFIRCSGRPGGDIDRAAQHFTG